MQINSIIEFDDEKSSSEEELVISPTLAHLHKRRKSPLTNTVVIE
jgi:hypothetical protein